MAGLIEKFVLGSIALAILFVLAGSILIPQFSSGYRYCQEIHWNCDVGASNGGNCTSLYQDDHNSTEISGTSHTEDGATYGIQQGCEAESYCLNCDTLGGYRGTNQGLLLLVLALGFVGIGLYFLSGIKIGKA